MKKNKIKKITNQVASFFKTSLGMQILYYALFSFSLWCIHLVLISLVSFFHLLLGHNIRTIGDWIGDRGWTLIIISKVIVFYLTVQFVTLKNKKINLLRGYLRNSLQFPRREVIVIWLFLFFGLFGLGQITINRTIIFELDRILLSMVGVFLFFGVDYAMLVVLEIFFPLVTAEDKWRKLFLFPLLFYYFSYATFIYEANVDLKLYAYFFLLIYLGEWRRRNLTFPIIFLVAFIVPICSLMGLDPVWNSTYTFFKFEKVISTFSMFILIIFSIVYLERALRVNPEYIYRD